MTSNQINYQKNLEDLRSHRVNEELTKSRDLETARSNRAREYETNRSNLARELETNRANLAQEAWRQYDTDSKYASSIYGSDSARLASMYGADRSAAASMYNADRGYDSHTDSAYINKWGVSKSDLGTAVNTVKETLPQVPGVAKGLIERQAERLWIPALVGAAEVIKGGVQPSGLAKTITKLGGTQNGKTTK